MLVDHMVKNVFIETKEYVFMDSLWKDFVRDLRHSKDRKLREMGKLFRRIEKGEATKEEMRIFLTDKMKTIYNDIPPGNA